MIESGFESGEISREQLVSALKQAREAGVTEENFQEDFSEAFELLGAWIDQESVKIGKGVEDEIRFNVVRAELYLELGFTEAAREMFEDTVEYAENIGDDELAESIRAKM